MSVAFRREGDDEHLEPKFELPLPPGPNLVTPAGLEQIRQKVAEIEAVVRAMPEDDLALKPAKRDLRYWQTRLSTADVQPSPSGENVAFGCRVRFCLNSKEREIVIVGHDEAEPTAGKLSFSSPLARALMGAAPGDTLDFNGLEDAIEVLAISPA